MSITVNNRKVEYVDGETVKKLLKRMKFVFPMIIVKVNGEVISRSRFAETVITAGAAVEIFHIESGG
jgi:thiamine biosynthesis protein ThiS